MRTSIATVLGVAALTFGATAQTVAPPESSARPVARLHVSVTAGDRYVGPLDASSFTVRVGGATAEVRGLETDLATSLAVVVDVSGSMRLPKPEETIQALAASLVEYDRLRECQTEYTVVAVSTEVSVLSEFVTDPRQIFRGPIELPDKRRTALYEAVQLAVERLSARPSARRVLVVISDGGDNQSEPSYPVVKRLLLERGVIVYSIYATGPLRRPNEESVYGESILESFAEMTGGFATRTYDVKRELVERFREVADDVRNQYTLSVAYEDRGKHKGNEVRVAVHPPAGWPGKPKPKVRVRDRVFAER